MVSRAYAVIRDVEGDGVFEIRKGDVHSSGLGMACNIRECFLARPENAVFHRLVDLEFRSGDVQLHGDATSAFEPGGDDVEGTRQ